MAEGWVSTDQGSHLRGRRSKDTAPELALRRALHAQGARFRLHRKIQAGCTPDLVLPKLRIAVFVDGDFWHGCPLHGRSRFVGPNASLWRAKLARTKQRDEQATANASAAGWIVVRLWECEIKSDPANAARRVLAAASEGSPRLEAP